MGRMVTVTITFTVAFTITFIASCHFGEAGAGLVTRDMFHEHFYRVTVFTKRDTGWQRCMDRCEETS